LRNRLIGSLTLGVWLACVGALHGQQPGNTCDPQDPPWSKPLTAPDDVVPTGGVLDASLVVRKQEICVPVWSTNLCKGTYTRCTEPGSTAAPCSAAAPCANARTCLGTETSCTKSSECTTEPKKCVKAWGWDKPQLRTYGRPKDPKKPFDPANPNDSNLKWGLPGPTLRARTEILTDPSQPKSGTNKAVSPGTRIKVALYNHLDKQDYSTAHHCDDAGPKYKPEYPECFHGPNVTNLHYHGSHVSPQPPQDYVLLNLWPFGSTNVPVSDKTPTPKVGKYQTDINPLPWNQPPGTHWYHPHKHGSTALQVLNGMSGALIITGPFDDWLDKLYKGQLVDRLLVIQQVQAELEYFDKGIQDNPPQVLVNGLATPKISMRPGEIQRFRFIGATVRAAAALEIGFDSRIKGVRQIAQDGVQFAWQNYDRQPYRDSEGSYSNFDLPPGTRSDFLIKAPDVVGTYVIEHSVFVEDVAEKLRQLQRTLQTVEDRVPDMAPPIFRLEGGRSVSVNKPPVDATNGNPLLFTIEVAGSPKSMDFPVTQATDRACAGPRPPEHCWPKTPSYLEDLAQPRTATRKVDFSMMGDSDTGEPPSFFINKTQYQDGCAGAAMARSTTEDWLVSNLKYTPGGDDALLPHPFHIHVNPFQVVRNADRTFEPPYVWQDTIALPVVNLVSDVGVPEDQQPISSEADAKTKCPAVCDGESHATWTGQWTAKTCACQTVTSRPAGPIWSNRDAQEKCPRACAADNSTWNGQWRTTIQNVLSECDCVTKSDSVLLRQHFEDYTGGYVIHCHFLGHEDRGMMWNVETVCDPRQPWKLGTTQEDGGPDDCARPSGDALKCCPNVDGGNCGPRK
jgi:FtsP/CotA-like multicopper oxidase with cupredoxin domain